MLWKYNEDVSVLIRLLEWYIRDKELDISDVVDNSINIMSEIKTFSRCKLWTHESLIYKRLISKICDNVRHYIMTAIWWSSDVKVLYWWRLITKKLKRFICKDCLYSTLLINHCVRSSAMIWYEHIVIS